MTRLDADSQEQLERRAEIGRKAIAATDGDELEAMASDVISDILTALYGPAGSYTLDGADGTCSPCDWNEEALKNAQAMLDRAFRSYEGDAEDYTVDSNA